MNTFPRLSDDKLGQCLSDRSTQTHRSLNEPSGMLRTRLLCFMPSILSLFLKARGKTRHYAILYWVKMAQGIRKHLTVCSNKAGGRMSWNTHSQIQNPSALCNTWEINIAMNLEVVWDRSIRHSIMTEYLLNKYKRLSVIGQNGNQIIQPVTFYVACYFKWNMSQTCLM